MLKECFPNTHFDLIVKYRNEFSKISNEFPLDTDDFILILGSEKFSIEQKETIIHTNAEIILKDKTLKDMAFDILNIWHREKMTSPE